MKLEAALLSVAAIVRATRGFVVVDRPNHPNARYTSRRQRRIEPLALFETSEDDSAAEFVGIKRNGKHQDSSLVRKLQKDNLALQSEFDTFRVEQFKRERERDHQLQRLKQLVQAYENGEADSSNTGKLLKEKLELQSEFNAYKEEQKKREKQWECTVESLNRTIEDLEMHLEGDGDASPEESQEWRLSSRVEYGRKLTALKQEHSAKIRRIKEEYAGQLQSRREKHEIEAKVAEEQVMQMNIHHQKLLQGIKDRAAQKEEQLMEEAAAKLRRKKEEIAASRAALSKASDRVIELEDIVMSMHSDRQSLRGLAQCALQTVRVRGVKCWGGFLEKLRNRLQKLQQR